MSHNPFVPDPAMSPALWYAAERMNPFTNSPVDVLMAGLLLRQARSEGPQALAAMQGLLMRGRAEFRVTLGLWQRKWQRQESRRPSRAKHHDSVAIRERYVRCA